MPLIKISVSDATYISERYRFNNYFKADSLRIKLDRKYNNSYIILLKFDNNMMPPNIKRVTLNLFLNELNNTKTNYSYNKVSIYRNLEDFNQETVFWDNSPSKLQEPVGSINISNKNYGLYVQCDITDLVCSWRNGLVPNFGVSIIVSESKFNEDIYFSSKGVGNPPFLAIEYIEDDTKIKKNMSRDSLTISKNYSYKNHNLNNCKFYRYKIINNFSEKIFILRNRDRSFYSETIKIVNSRTVSFFIQNLGVNPVDVYLQISPDGITFIDDPQIETLTSQNMTVLTPYKFAKYIRVAFKSQSDCVCNKVKVWYQAQLLNYTFE